MRAVSVARLREVELVAGTEKEYRLRARRFDGRACVGADLRAPAQRAEIQCFQMREGLIRPLDRQHRFPIVEPVAFVQRVHAQGAPVVGAELEHCYRFVDPTKVAGRLAGNLHQDLRRSLVLSQRGARSFEVHVCVESGADLLDRQAKQRRIETLPTAGRHRYAEPVIASGSRIVSSCSRVSRPRVSTTS